MTADVFITIISIVLGSTALFNLVQFLITRRDIKKEKLEEKGRSDSQGIAKLDEKLTILEGKIDKINQERQLDRAVECRIRILQASDSLRHGYHKHSEEYFDQLNEDITNYENYCNTHSDFKNNKANHAISYINQVYAHALETGNFYTGGDK